MPMTAREVEIEGSTLFQNGRRVLLCNDTLVTPAWAVLPLGCSWSLYFAQSVTEAIASRAPALDGLSPLHDKSGGSFPWSAQGCPSVFTCYVDNLGRGRRPTLSWTDGGTSTPHKSELGQKIKSLGIDLDGLSLCLSRQ